MRAILRLGLVLILLSASFCLLTVMPGKAGAKTLVVPENYPTIASAIANANAGDTVLVRAGVYFENPIVDKSILLIGENRANTVIVGAGGSAGGTVLNISASNVKISGFTIESANYSSPAFYAHGISVGTNNCTIIGNNIVNNYNGVFVAGWGDLCGGKSSITISENNIKGNLNNGIRIYGGSSNIISGNDIDANGFGTKTSGAGSIFIWGYANTISGNNITNNIRGIGLGCSNSVVYRNNISANGNWGLYIGTSNNIVAENTIAGNQRGIVLSPIFAPAGNRIYHNNFVNNTLNAETGSLDNVQSWDNGYCSGGNYWSNYTGADSKNGANQDQIGSDGVCDAPMVLDANNIDRYPLMVPLNVSTAGNPPAPIQAALNFTNNMVAHWTLNQIAPNGVVADLTSNNPANVGSDVNNVSCAPTLAKGIFGNCLNFTEWGDYVYANSSPSLDITGEITIDCWINMATFENTTYNNIVVKSARNMDNLPAVYRVSRLVGIAVNGEAPDKENTLQIGVLRAYVYTEAGFNEIVTITPAISLHQWTHITFTRSLITGMHLYVNGVEQSVKVTAGVQNPVGAIKPGTELYIGHDYNGMIDEVKISNIAQEPAGPAFWLQIWFWAPIAALILIIVIGAYYYPKKKKPQPATQILRNRCIRESWKEYD